MGRPAVVTGAAAAIAAGLAAAHGAAGGSGTAELTTLAIDRSASDTSVVELRMAQSDAERVTADRSATNNRRSVVAAQQATAEQARAAKVAKQRKEAAAAAARAAARTRVIANAQKDPKAVARLLLPEYGFGESQWSCLEDLWIGESDWRWWAENPSSGAYGIPQSLPARKMATVGADYRTNPVTQIKWGLQYIKDAYGTPCSALDAWESRSPHWY
ncbi:MAG: hypothetical protein ACRCYX_09555 [Dermatophilaceae bacterium]